jgi:hypothetical protein
LDGAACTAAWRLCAYAIVVRLLRLRSERTVAFERMPDEGVSEILAASMV